MRVLPPIEITAARLTSSTAAEPAVGEVAFVHATSYAQYDRVYVGAPTSTVTISNASPAVITWADHGLPNGQAVIVTTTGTLPAGLTAGQTYYVVNRAAGTFQLSADVGGVPIATTTAGSGTHTATAHIHRRYESLEAANSGNPPAVSPNKWLDLGPTNRWAMFDLDRGTGTITASPLVVEITPGQRIDAIGAIGMVADEILIEVVVGGVTVWSVTKSLARRNTVGWYTYFFGAFRYVPDYANFAIPPYSGATIKVTFTRASGNITVGGLLLGTGVYLGETEVDPESDLVNASRVDRDEFGTVQSIVRRRNIPKNSQRVLCPKENVNTARDVRDRLGNATVALWSWLDDSDDGYFEAGLVLGFATRFTIGPGDPGAMLNIETMEV